MYDYDLYDYSAGVSTTSSIGTFPLIGGSLASILIKTTSVCLLQTRTASSISIVPIYNMIVLLEITELPLWYIVLFFIPFANIYALFKIYIELAHKFGKSTGFGVATVFFSIVCLPILAFSKTAEYK